MVLERHSMVEYLGEPEEGKRAPYGRLAAAKGARLPLKRAAKTMGISAARDVSPDMPTLLAFACRKGVCCQARRAPRASLGVVVTQ